jgi:hypothetical protein
VEVYDLDAVAPQPGARRLLKHSTLLVGLDGQRRARQDLAQVAALPIVQEASSTPA